MLATQTIQELFVRKQNQVYLNTSSCGLISSTGVEKMNAFMQSLSVQGSRRAEYFLAEELPAIKRIISAFIDADENELALVPNFSFGLNAIIPSLHHHRNVLLFDDDYPSLTQPFLLNKFNISWVRQMDGFSFDLQEIEEIIANKSIDIAAVSHVQYQTGYCIDIQAISAICKRYNVLLIVDGTQSLGAMPFSFPAIISG